MNSLKLPKIYYCTFPVKQLSTEEIDRVLSQLEAGVDVALQRAKAWSKYMKDITSYIERKAHLGNISLSQK